MDADSEETVRLWRAVAETTYTFFPPEAQHTEAEDRAFYASNIASHELWLATDGETLLGYMALEDDLIDRLYVAVDRQRTGVRTLLLDQAKTLRPTGLRLFTHQANTGARRFYEKHGFTAERFGLSPSPENLPDVEYRWRPEPDPAPDTK